jgi:hypothetical protein
MATYARIRRRLRASLLLSALAVVSGCNKAPSESTARIWFDSSLRSQIGAPVETRSFTMTAGSLTILNGIPSYTASYQADVLFPEGNQVDCLLRLCVLGRLPPTVPKSIIHFQGELVFQKAEGTWVVAPQESGPPQAVSASIASDFGCPDISAIVRSATQNESIRITDIVSSVETSRSMAQLSCNIQAMLSDGRTSRFEARAYQEGARVAMTLARPSVAVDDATTSATADMNAAAAAALDAANAAVADLQNATREAQSRHQ